MTVTAPLAAETAAAPAAPQALPSLVGMSREELGGALSAIGVPAGQIRMRTGQLWHWLYVRGATDFAEMTNVSKGLRADLAAAYSVGRPEIVTEQISEDGTRKWLLRFPSRGAGRPVEVETVYIPEEGRGTLCLSSQVGCTLSCSFCHTGTQKLVRNLTAEEIVGQVLLARDRLGDYPAPGVSKSAPAPERDASKEAPSTGRLVSNIVMMGMGEPLYNYDNVRQALHIAADGDGIALSKRRITLSTSGVVPMIPRVGAEIGVLMAISLHAVTDELRDVLVPLNRKYPIAELMEACRTYPGLSNARRITFEYVMLKGINDTPAEARALVKLLSGIPAKINLIPFNPWPGSPYECSDWEAIERFADIVNRAGYASPVRTPRGRDILAACGQLKSESERLRIRERMALEAMIAGQAMAPSARGSRLDRKSSSVSETYPRLFHYTSEAGAYGILESQTLWATHFSYLNDAHELHSAESLLADAFEVQLERYLERQANAGTIDIAKGHSPKSLAEAEKERYVSSLYEAVLKTADPFIASFCAHKIGTQAYVDGLLSQWRGYGRGGGFALEFDSAELENCVEADGSAFGHAGYYVLKVAYADEARADSQIRADLAQVARVVADLVPAELNSWVEKPDIGYSYEPFLRCMLRIKHAGFREESEVRCAYMRPRNTPATEKEAHEIRFRQHSKARIPFVTLFSQAHTQLPIKRILIGPHPNAELRKNSMELFLDQRRLSIRVETSGIPFIPEQWTALADLLRILFLVPIGFIAAVLAASLTILAGWYGHEPGVLTDVAATGYVIGIGVFVVLRVGALAFIPALLVAVLAELFRWRSVFLYLVVGGALGLLAGRLPVLGWEAGNTRDGLLLLAAGFVGALTYWLIAGRFAGFGRAEEPPPPAAPPSISPE